MDNRDEAMKDGDDINVNIEEILAAAENNESEFPEESQATSVPVTDISDRDEEVDLELDTNEPYRPPSALSANTALKDSYLWVSPRPSAPGPYVVGVDEAGRGPALGPLVYGMAFCPVSFVEEQLLEMGFDDSKQLTHEKRVKLLKSLASDNENMGYAVNVISPQAISSGMLAKPPINLNMQSQNATIALLSKLLAEPYSLPISEVYVDALGPAEKYEKYLQSRFPSLSITVRNKADSIYKIVGAASVAAKVTRDYLVEGWVWEENVADGVKIWGKGDNLGSGYPSDPNTKRWIASNLEKTFGFPSVARFSWAPIRQTMESNGHAVQWVDEGQKSLMKAFEAVGAHDKGRSIVTKDLSISSVSRL